MALVKYGGGIIQASGSIAGTTHARNRFGNYIRARTKPVNPNTNFQIEVRTYLSYLTAKWHDTLTSTMRGTWATYAAAVAMKNRLGEVVYLTGFNMYLRYNIVRMQMENSQATSCLGPPALPEKDPGFAASGSAETQLLTITMTTGLPWRDIAASVMAIYMGVPQIVTRNFFNGPWRHVGPILGNAVAPHTMTAPFTLVLGQKVWVYGRVATGPTDGRLSEPMTASFTVGA